MSSVFATRYYQNDDYKQKHLTYMKQKINCPICNKEISRSNQSHHNKTAKEHQFKQLINFETLTDEEVTKLMEKLNARKTALK